jgi:hypothetical protein
MFCYHGNVQILKLIFKCLQLFRLDVDDHNSIFRGFFFWKRGKMDVFLMVRRKKTTIFLDAKENTTVFEIKKIIEGKNFFDSK